jgi:hypothetical protein
MSTTRSRRKSRVRSVVATAAVTAGALALAPAASAEGGGGWNAPQGPPVVALTESGRLITVDTFGTHRVLADVAVTGLQPGEELVGIDRRPKDGALYAIARSPQATGLYAVDSATGAVTRAADLVTTAGAPVVLLGTEFGVDFNPAADAIRIVSDGGQNLRVLPENRTVEGTARPIGTTFVDGTLNEGGFAAPGVAAAAYTGNDNDPATGTKLYVLDADTDRILVQDPPNAGTLGSGVALKARTTELAGFDILTVGGVDYAYGSLTKDSWDRSRLVKIDLASGQVRELGWLPTKDGVRGIAL